MPGLDYNEDYLQTENKIKSLETYNQVKESENQILSQQQSSMEMDAAQTSTPLSQIQNESKRFQRQVKTQLDRLLDLNQLLPSLPNFPFKMQSTVACFILSLRCPSTICFFHFK